MQNLERFYVFQCMEPQVEAPCLLGNQETFRVPEPAKVSVNK